MSRTTTMRNKTLKLAVLFLAVSIIILPSVAFAADPGDFSFLSCLTSPAACAIYLTTYVISVISGLLINLASFFVGIGFIINSHITTSPAVKTGFGVTLSLANLGFVLGIIVIAIATILRMQSYSIKQILWKLVVAAIFINFSLVIAGTILNFSDSITKYFHDATGFSSSLDFAKKLTAGYQPQSLLKAPQLNRSETCQKIQIESGSSLAWYANFASSFICENNIGTLERIWDYFSGDAAEKEFARTILLITNMIFSVIMGFVIFITLAALAVMLFIRYVTIGILLILMPLAWLAWIFPQFSGHWTKWWNTFLRWTFFPPLVVFFLYLAMKTVGDSGYLGGIFNSGGRGEEIASLSGGLMELLGNSTIIAAAMQQIMIVALALGGLFAANSLGIAGASTAMGLAKGAGNWAKGAVWKGTKRAGTRPLRGELGRHATEKLETAGAGWGEKGGRLRRSIGKIGKGIMRPVRELGVGAAKLRAPTEKMALEKQRELGKLSLEEQARRVGTEDAPGQLAIMSNIKKSMSSSNNKESSAAQKAFDSLPKDMRDKENQLNLLYGRGGVGKWTGKEMPETFAGQGPKDKIGEVQEKLTREIEKDKEEGKDTSDKEKIVEELKEIDEKPEEEKKSAWEDLRGKVNDAIAKEGDGRSARTLEDLEKAIREQTKAFSEVGEEIKEAAGEKGKTASVGAGKARGNVTYIDGKPVILTPNGPVPADDEEET